MCNGCDTVHITLHYVCHRSLSLLQAVRNSLPLHVYDGKSPRKRPAKHTAGLDCGLVRRRRLISHLHDHRRRLSAREPESRFLKHIDVVFFFVQSGREDSLNMHLFSKPS